MSFTILNKPKVKKPKLNPWKQVEELAMRPRANWSVTEASPFHRADFDDAAETVNATTQQYYTDAIQQTIHRQHDAMIQNLRGQISDAGLATNQYQFTATRQDVHDNFEEQLVLTAAPVATETPEPLPSFRVTSTIGH